MISLRCGGVIFSAWTQAEVLRSIQDLSGSFSFEYYDQARADAALPMVGYELVPVIRALKAGLPAEIAIDGEVVLIGHVEDFRFELLGETISCELAGRDLTGDLVDCTANPLGPYLYKNLDLLAVATRICQPFGIPVRADVPLGDPFGTVAIDASEPAISVLEKLARQRGVLITSDGVGGLVLTRAGRRRGPIRLQQPGNIHGIETQQTWRGRYSDYWIKGQSPPLLRPSAAPTLDATTMPLSTATPAAPAPGVRTQIEAAAITRFGHAIDPAVRRYRPRVWLSRTLSGSSEGAQRAADPVDPNDGQALGESSAGRYPGRHRSGRRKPVAPRTDASPWTLQDQAEWRLRTTRALSMQQTYVVIGHRAGPAQVLWRPNELVAVDDPMSQVLGDQLVVAVGYVDGPDGARTRLLATDPDAYDLTGDDDNANHPGRRRSRRTGAIDGTRGRL